MPVGRTIPSTRHGETTERRADVPLGDGDSDRDGAQPRSGWLSSCSTDDSVDTTPLQADGPGSGSSRGPIDTHSCCCLRRRPRCQPTYPDSRLVRRANAALCVLLATVPAGTAVPSNQRRQHSRCEAPLRLTQSRRLRAITLSAHCRALTPLNFTPLDFSTPLPHTAEYACVL